jgi:hypothetical protein
MISKKSLTRKLQALVELFQEYEHSCVQQWEKEAFLRACSMAIRIEQSVGIEDYDEAERLWKLLQRFISDSVPFQEGFLSRYMPLRQSIINFGLR